MRETVKPPLLTAVLRRPGVLVASVLSIVALIAAAGCSVKTTVKVKVPQGIREAKTASFEDLLGIIRNYDKIKALSGNELELVFTSSRKMDIGELERFQKVHGYIALRRPDSIHLVLLVPIVNSTLLELVSVGDRFSCWTRENKLYEGRNSPKDLVFEDPSAA